MSTGPPALPAGYDWASILVPGHCYVNNYTVGIPVTTYGYGCAPHFYCPNATAAVVASLPQLCPATIDCQLIRLGQDFCEPQGPYEPRVCPHGRYCPNGSSSILCPQGTWCPVGTITPRPCPPLSSCPAGSTVPVSYGGMIACLVIDVALAAALILPRALLGTASQKPPGGAAQRVMAWLRGRRARANAAARTVPEDEEALRAAAPEAPLPHGEGGAPSELADFVAYFTKALNGRTDVGMEFRFEGLGLSLPGGKSVLAGVTGEIKSRRLTAIMGPSGAGKTTFMNVLMGKVNRTSGTLKINGHPAEMRKYKEIIGYVPQEDIMLRELTVREIISHSARIRLPRSWTAAEIEDYVDAVLNVLNLVHVQDNLIGDETTRGVSGGQRKRVNIGMELAAVPLALFLDEPTSGLDSTAALKVAEILKQIAATGLTVVSVIHQPRYEIFQQFDDILMIAPGGETAYLGPTAYVIEYFEKLGFYFDPRANPADILMDILSDKGVNLSRHYTPSDLIAHWASTGKAWVASVTTTGGGTGPVADAAAAADEVSTTPEDLVRIAAGRGASFVRQAVLCHNRYMVQQYRRSVALGLEIGVASLAGGLMGIAIADVNGELYKGILVSPYELISASTLEWLVPQIGLLVGIACGLAGAPAGVKVFGEERSVYWREAASGHNKLAYYLGKTVSTTYRFVITALHFAAIFVWLATPASSFGFLFVQILLLFYCVYGLSAIVSMLVRREDAALLAVVTCLFAAVFCGYGPTIKNARSWGLEFVWVLSFNRWSTEAMFSQELSVYDGVYNTSMTADHYGYTLGHEGLNFAFMLLLGNVFRFAAFWCMVLLHRDKQK
ncbi:hypothetical protein DFJ73DRAFT_659752 [Zopfochytrium polystomum]|nr:hypothetical protein DFJ73DRAFT_659752 [Zopfochytrium polystomum]